jgi:hypothetical protein
VARIGGMTSSYKVFVGKPEQKILLGCFCFFFFGEGPRSRCYGRTATLRLIVQPYDKDYSFFIFSCNKAPVE